VGKVRILNGSIRDGVNVVARVYHVEGDYNERGERLFRAPLTEAQEREAYSHSPHAVANYDFRLAAFELGCRLLRKVLIDRGIPESLE